MRGPGRGCMQGPLACGPAADARHQTPAATPDEPIWEQAGPLAPGACPAWAPAGVTGSACRPRPVAHNLPCTARTSAAGRRDPGRWYWLAWRTEAAYRGAVSPGASNPDMQFRRWHQARGGVLRIQRSAAGSPPGAKRHQLSQHPDKPSPLTAPSGKAGEEGGQSGSPHRYAVAASSSLDSGLTKGWGAPHWNFLPLLTSTCGSRSDSQAMVNL